MTKQDKRLERMRQNPQSVRPEEMDALLLSLGFVKRQKGSHAVYKFGRHIQTIPYRKPFLLPIYVKQVLSMLDEMIDAGELEF